MVDALKGYHQVPLDEQSANLTTFSTPLGRFQYMRLPMGVALAGDDYGRRVSEVLDCLPSCRRVVEDIVRNIRGAPRDRSRPVLVRLLETISYRST